MPFSIAYSRTRTASRLAAAALLSAGIAGCSTDISRFQENVFSTGSIPSGTNPPAELNRSVPLPQGAPVGRVDSRPLAGELPAPPPTHRSATGAPAPQRVAAAPAASTSQRPAGGIHVVTSGETLTSIAKRYSKSRADIARANGIAPNASVRIGQKISVPGLRQDKIKSAQAAPAPKAKTPAPIAQAPQAKPAGAPPKPLGQLTQPTAPVAPQKTAAVKETARIAVPAEQTTAELKDTQPSATGATPTFRWPVRGRVIAGFGPKPSGQQNDGINLAVPEGTSVKAAEDGVVAYSGSELKGYGNLVLVRHSNGYVTAYAHASELMVKKGDAVKRGQIIARAGQTGGVGSPQLHFEIRKGSKPVDPVQYLSGT